MAPFCSFHVYLSFFIGFFILTACQPVKYNLEREFPTDIPDSFVYESDEGLKIPIEGPWWTPFEREDLNEVMNTVLENNLDLKSAWARIYAAHAEVLKARANKKPEINLGVGIELEWNPVGTDDSGVGLGGLINPTFAYEYDLYGRLDSLVRSAFHSYQFSYYDQESTSLVLTGAAFDLFVEIIKYNELMGLSFEQEKISGRLLDLLRLRFMIGETTALDLNLQKLQLKSLDLRKIEQESSLDQSYIALSILLGRNPDRNYFLSKSLPLLLPPKPYLENPIDLLFNRPDIKSAYEDFLASGFDLKAAILNCYPRLVVPISLEIAIGGLSNVLDEALVEAAITLIGPLYDGGRRRAEVRKQRAIIEDKLNRLGSQFLKAINEVEKALVEEREAAFLIETIKEQIEQAGRVLSMAEESYSIGIVDYLTVIDAIQSLQALERLLVERQADLMIARGKLYRSLGMKCF